jgi:hypothetical protein
MRDKIVWIGVIIVALGIVLPWTTYSVSLGGNRVDGTTPGYEYLQSFIALAIAVAGALLGIKLSKQTKRLTLIASGAIVVIVAGAALADLSGPDQVIQPPSAQLQPPQNAPREIREAQRRFHQPNMTARVSSDPHIGVFVTILGGLLVGIEGFTSTMREVE